MNCAALKKIVLSVALSGFIAVGIAGALFYDFIHRPIDPVLGTITVQIPKGRGFPEISTILEENGLVTNKRSFYLLVRLKNAGRFIKAGEYELSGSMTPLRLVEKLKSGSVKKYNISIPEGFTVAQAADRFAAWKLADAEMFRLRACDIDFLASMGIKAENAEGYLFPDTYVIDKTMDESDIISFMISRFKKEISGDMLERSQELGFTVHEVITLASIIEKESALEKEKPLISAVFHNRLKKKMRLQSDPTVIYGMKSFTGNITKEDLRSSTPYNTYVIEGLPPGPICNPGAASINAALFPSDVDYLYFVSKNDGSHQFSSNLSSHSKAVIKYQIKRQK
ncbi:MAG: endolytic transglycosylase MltG [Syntrophales bacterium]|jgi:UPF0755 protein|nr:endolytic transglycosylase MltG [Syntrophales bacterium]MDY0043065.1 endolytic transglycosylase MltG [Syntrophales bacterium]